MLCYAVLVVSRPGRGFFPASRNNDGTALRRTAPRATKVL